jgi:pimeloyl-ACP methyl ester carboxylesterase
MAPARWDMPYKFRRRTMCVSPMSMRVLLITMAAMTVFCLSARGGDWPGTKWNDKLAQPYEEWKKAKDAISELAARAGATDIVFCPEASQRDFTVPLPAGLTLREAVQAAASVCALDANWEGGKLTVQKAGRVGDWAALVGAQRPTGRTVAGSTIFLPKDRKAAGPVPWVWYAPAQGWGACNAWMLKRFLDQGVALAMVGIGESQGNAKGRATYTELYESLVKDFGFARKAALLPQSRGGLMLYNWAAEHPECVAGIGGIYTVCDLRSYPGIDKAAEAYGLTKEEMLAQLAQNNPIDRLAPLAKAKIPILHIHGDKDGTVPLDKNSGELVKRYLALDGNARMIVVPGKGHEVAREFFQNQELTDFLIACAKAGAGARSPASAPDGKSAKDSAP